MQVIEKREALLNGFPFASTTRESWLHRILSLRTGPETPLGEQGAGLAVEEERTGDQDGIAPGRGGVGLAEAVEDLVRRGPGREVAGEFGGAEGARGIDGAEENFGGQGSQDFEDVVDILAGDRAEDERGFSIGELLAPSGGQGFGRMGIVRAIIR